MLVPYIARARLPLGILYKVTKRGEGYTYQIYLYVTWYHT